MIRSGSREQRKKMLPGGSGSGDLDDVTDMLLAHSPVLYPGPTITAATVAAATTIGNTKFEGKLLNYVDFRGLFIKFSSRLL